MIDNFSNSDEEIESDEECELDKINKVIHQHPMENISENGGEASGYESELSSSTESESINESSETDDDNYDIDIQLKPEAPSNNQIDEQTTSSKSKPLMSYIYLDRKLQY